MASKVEWAKHVEAWRESGASRDDYAAAHGLRPATLQWWVSKLARDAGKRTKRSRVRFAQVVEGAAPKRIEPRTTTAASTLDVVVARGRTVRVSRGFDRDLLRAVIEALETP
jgi:hypothetical protein